MIIGIEGIPGSGKSYEAVAYHILPALKSGRKVITNLPLDLEAFAAIDPEYPDLIEIKNRPSPILGRWDASNIASVPAFQPFDDGHVEPVAESVFTFGTVWDYYDDWHAQDGRGPLYVIDECHVSLPKLGTSAAVVEWFKLHRHFNVDVVLLTQSFRDINQPIALLLATLIKCRKADILGKADHYIRKVHAGYRGAVIQTGQRVYKKQYFGLYKSHTQGVSLSEEEARDVSPMIVKFNRIKWAVVALAVTSMVWAFWPKKDTNVFGLKTKPTPTPAVAPAPRPAPVASAPVQPASVAASAPALPASFPSEAIKKSGEFGPLAGKQISIMGMLASGEAQVTIFVVSDGGRRMFDVTSDELERAGYSFELFGYCFGWLKFDDSGVKHAVTCDAPELGQGTQDRPIVYDSAAGRWSNDTARRARYGAAGASDVDVPDLPPAQVAPAPPAASEPPSIHHLRAPTGVRPPTGLRPQTPIR